MAGWGGSVVRASRRLVLARYGAVCWLCGGVIDVSLAASVPGGLTVDHRLPRSLGGSDRLENLAPAHRRCNLSRGARPARSVRPVRPAEDGTGFFDST